MKTEHGEHSIGKDRQIGYNDQKVNGEIAKTFKVNMTNSETVGVMTDKITNEKSVAQASANVMITEIRNHTEVMNTQIERLSKDQTMTVGQKMVEKEKLSKKQFEHIEKSIARASKDTINEIQSVREKLFSSNIKTDQIASALMQPLVQSLDDGHSLEVLISNSPSQVEVALALTLARDYPTLSKIEADYASLEKMANYRFSPDEQHHIDGLIDLNKAQHKLAHGLSGEISEFIDSDMLNHFTSSKY